MNEGKKQDNRKKEGYCIVRNKTERYKKNDDKSERGKEKKIRMTG